MILVLPFPFTKALIVSRTSSVVLKMYPTLIHQHKKSENILITNTLLDLMMKSAFKLDELRPLNSCTVAVGQNFTNSSNLAAYSTTTIFP